MFVAVGLAETVIVLLVAALTVTGDGEFCVFVVIVLVLALGEVFVVLLPDEKTLVFIAELVTMLLFAIVIELPPDPNEPSPEFDANVITGAAPIVGDAVETTELTKLGADVTGITTGVIVVAVVCGPIAEQGGPPGQPVITS